MTDLVHMQRPKSHLLPDHLESQSVDDGSVEHSKIARGQRPVTTIATTLTALGTTKASHASRAHAVRAAGSGLQARRRTSMTWTAKVSSLVSSPCRAA
jgi:hypothetical protein